MQISLFWIILAYFLHHLIFKKWLPHIFFELINLKWTSHHSVSYQMKQLDLYLEEKHKIPLSLDYLHHSHPRDMAGVRMCKKKKDGFVFLFNRILERVIEFFNLCLLNVRNKKLLLLCLCFFNTEKVDTFKGIS